MNNGLSHSDSVEINSVENKHIDRGRGLLMATINFTAGISLSRGEE